MGNDQANANQPSHRRVLVAASGTSIHDGAHHMGGGGSDEAMVRGVRLDKLASLEE